MPDLDIEACWASSYDTPLIRVCPLPKARECQISLPHNFNRSSASYWAIPESLIRFVGPGAAHQDTHVAAASVLKSGMLGYPSASALGWCQIPFNMSNPKLASVTTLAFKFALKSYSDMLAKTIALWTCQTRSCEKIETWINTQITASGESRYTLRGAQ
jgi:hypothetical protein